MKAPYYSLMKELRLAFPQPVSDRIHDAYFDQLIMQTIEQVDGMKSKRPMLGGPVELDFEAARKCRIGEEPLKIRTGHRAACSVPLRNLRLGTPEVADQCDSAGDNSQHHRQSSALDLQPESGQRRDLVECCCCRA